MSLLSLLVAMGSAGHAACDAKALVKELADAAPARSAEIAVELSDCNKDEAKKVVPGVVSRFVPSPKGYAGALAAVRLGSDGQAAVTTWAKGMQSDERSDALAAIGATCGEDPVVQQFFIDAAKSLKDEFWTQRWYRPLESCRAAGIQELLHAEVKRGMQEKKQAWTFGVLETYSRNLGAGAVPQLEVFGKTVTDEEALMRIIDAFPDAARVGSAEGTDAKAAAAAGKAIVEASPHWPPKVVEKARYTLQALGLEQDADALVGARFKDRLQKDQRLLWGAVVVETAACKNGKAKQRVHVASVTDPAQTWPDQLKEKVEASVGVAWELTLAKSCKGEGTLDLRVPAEPFADAAAWKAWADGQVKEVERAGKQTGLRPVRVDQEQLDL